MKKSLLTIALATAALAAGSVAYAQDTSSATDDSSSSTMINAKAGWYLDLDAGASRANSRKTYNDTNYAGALTGGYRWAVSPDMSIGAELGAVYLGKFDARQSAQQAYANNGGMGQTQSKTNGATLGASMRVNLTQSWYLNFRGGALDARTSGLTNSDLPVRRSISNNIGYYAGLGTGWDINQHWGVGLNYNYYSINRGSSTIYGQREGTRYNMDTNTLTADVEYRF